MYTYTWRKYLPLIRLLVKKSAQGPQTAMLNQTDFLKFAKSKKPILNFTLDIKEGKFSVLKMPPVAMELIEILMEDPAARALIRSGQYSLTLAKNYQFTVNNLNAAAPLAEEDAVAAEGETSAEDQASNTSDNSDGNPLEDQEETTQPEMAERSA